MSNPQQPEPNSGIPGTDAPGGPVPPDNQPGHHPPTEQDKPDLSAFAEKLGATAPAERSDPREEPKVSLPATGGRRVPVVGAAVGIAAVVALVLAVVTGRRRRRTR